MPTLWWGLYEREVYCLGTVFGSQPTDRKVDWNKSRRGMSMVQQNIKKSKREMTPAQLFEMHRRGEKEPEEIKIVTETKPQRERIDIEELFSNLDKRRQRNVKDWKSWYTGFADGVFFMRSLLKEEE